MTTDLTLPLPLPGNIQPAAGLRWFEFDQNNSGGVFGLPAHVVWVQAPSAEKATEAALANGVYFNGCEMGRDCSCCGDRWSSLWSTKGEDSPFEVSDGDQSIERNVLCDELPARRGTYDHYLGGYADSTFWATEEEPAQSWARYVTKPRKEPWTAEEIKGQAWGQGKTLMLIPHEGRPLFCKSLSFFEKNTFGY